MVLQESTPKTALKENERWLSFLSVHTKYERPYRTTAMCHTSNIAVTEGFRPLRTIAMYHTSNTAVSFEGFTVNSVTHQL